MFQGTVTSPNRKQQVIVETQEVGRIIVQYRTPNTVEIDGEIWEEPIRKIATSNHINGRVCTVLTLDIRMAVSLNLLLVKAVSASSLPETEDEIGRNIAIIIDENGQSIHFTLIRKARPGDFDSSGNFLGTFTHLLTEDSHIVTIVISPSTAWKICSLFASDITLQLVQQILSALDRAGASIAASMPTP